MRSTNNDSDDYRVTVLNHNRSINLAEVIVRQDENNI